MVEGIRMDNRAQTCKRESSQRPSCLISGLYLDQNRTDVISLIWNRQISFELKNNPDGDFVSINPWRIVLMREIQAPLLLNCQTKIIECLPSGWNVLERATMKDGWITRIEFIQLFVLKCIYMAGTFDRTWLNVSNVPLKKIMTCPFGHVTEFFRNAAHHVYCYIHGYERLNIQCIVRTCYI